MDKSPDARLQKPDPGLESQSGKRTKGAGRTFAFGPGLVYLLGTIGPTDMIANSAAGAAYGYSLLWVLPVAYAIHYLIAEASARYVLATGESIMEGYGRLSRPLTLGLAAAILLRRHLSNLYEILLLGASVQLVIALPTEASSGIWAGVLTALAFVMMYRGGYAGVEAWCKPLLVLLTITLVATAVLARPDIGDVMRGLFVPTYPGSKGFYSYYMLLMALTGTTAGSITHLKYPTYVYEKGWRSLDAVKMQKTDLRLSIIGQFVLATLIQVAAAAAFHGIGGDLKSMEDLAMLFSRTLGEYGRILLGLGMLGAVFTTFLGSNTGYGLLVADVYERFIRPSPAGASPAYRDRRRQRAYRVLLVLFCAPPLYVLFTSWKPFWLSIFTSALFVAFVPLTMAGLLKLTADKKLLKEHVNRAWSNIVIGLLILVALFLTYQNVRELIGSLIGG